MIPDLSGVQFLSEFRKTYRKGLLVRCATNYYAAAVPHWQDCEPHWIACVYRRSGTTNIELTAQSDPEFDYEGPALQWAINQALDQDRQEDKQ